jgi:hypothetical protein
MLEADLVEMDDLKRPPPPHGPHQLVGIQRTNVRERRLMTSTEKKELAQQNAQRPNGRNGLDGKRVFEQEHVRPPIHPQVWHHVQHHILNMGHAIER